MASKEPGANVWQYRGNKSDAQAWSFEKGPGGTYYIISKISGHYLDLDSFSQENGANIKVWKKNLSTAQRWILNRIADCAPKGVRCNDGDPTTTNDIEDGNCHCAGTPSGPADSPLASQATIAPADSLGEGMVVYPNPTTGLVRLDLSNYEDISLECTIFNAMRRPVFKTSFAQDHAAEVRLNLENLSEGIYCMVFRSEGGNSTERVVIER